ncbi:hypothetical protein LINGRAHAP2_LOCUS29989 [Linum grandiflorum]
MTFELLPANFDDEPTPASSADDEQRASLDEFQPSTTPTNRIEELQSATIPSTFKAKSNS